MTEPTKKRKRRALTEYEKKRKREADRERAHTRITLGNVFNEWRHVKEKEGCKTDAEFAMLLLDVFKTSTPRKSQARPSDVTVSSTAVKSDHDHFVSVKHELDAGGVESPESTSSILNIKEEPDEVRIKPENKDSPGVQPVVKREDEEKGSDGAQTEKPLESIEHGGNSSDTDDSEDWSQSAERPTLQTHTEGNQEEAKGTEECCSSDSERSWEFNPSTKTPVRTKRQMEDYLGETPQDKVHKCADCGRVFPHSTKLKRHQLTHTLKCPFCAKSFTDVRFLEVHVRIHTGEKPFKCPICSKAFAKKGNLIRHNLKHMKTHTATSLFKCSIKAEVKA